MYKAKLVISGPMLEIYEYNISPNAGKRRNLSLEERKRREELFGPVSKIEMPQNSFYRSKKNAKRIMYCNAWRWLKENQLPFPPFFLTLTFAENIQDLKLAGDIFRKFIQRFNYELGYENAYLQYIAIREFQERGAIHYHLIIFNLPYMRDKVYKTIRELWGEGRIDLKMIKSMGTLTHYLSKYMVKDAENGKLAGLKRYLTSKRIKRPSIIKDDNYAVFDVAMRLENKLVYETKFEAGFIGTIKYRQYFLQRDDNLLELLGLDRNPIEAISSVIKE